MRIHKHDIDLTGEPLIHRSTRFHGLTIRLPGNRTLHIPWTRRGPLC